MECEAQVWKDFSVYELCKRIEAQNVLIVTNRPAIANAWYSDYIKFLGEESGVSFCQHYGSFKRKKTCFSRYRIYKRQITRRDQPYNCIEFVSLQDLKGSIYFGGEYDKLREVADINWDLLIIDEAHEVWILIRQMLHLTGLIANLLCICQVHHLKALANNKFPENAIFNWTYTDEQSAKHGNWIGPKGMRTHI